MTDSTTKRIYKYVLYALTEGFYRALLFGAIVLVFLVALAEWVVAGRMP